MRSNHRNTPTTPTERTKIVAAIATSISVVVAIVIAVVWVMLASDTTPSNVSTSTIPTSTANNQVESPGPGMPTPAFPAKFGDGFWLVGKQIAPVMYVNTDHDNKDCFWARVDKPTFPHPHMVPGPRGSSEWKAGRFKVVIRPTDKVFYTRDCGTWKHID